MDTPPDNLDTGMTVDNAQASQSIMIKRIDEDEAIMLSLEECWKQISTAHEEMELTKTVDRSLVSTLENLVPGILPARYPPESFTANPSPTNLAVALQASEKAAKVNVADAVERMMLTADIAMEPIKLYDQIPSFAIHDDDSRDTSQFKLVNELLTALSEDESTHGLRDAYIARYTVLIKEHLALHANDFTLGLYLGQGGASDILDAVRTDLTVSSVTINSRFEYIHKLLKFFPLNSQQKLSHVNMEPTHYRHVKAVHPYVDDEVHPDGDLVKFQTQVVINQQPLSQDVTPELIDRMLEGLQYSDSERLVSDRMFHTWKRFCTIRTDIVKLAKAEELVERALYNAEIIDHIFIAGKLVYTDLLSFVKLHATYLAMKEMQAIIGRGIFEAYVVGLTDRQWLKGVIAASPKAKEILFAVKDKGYF